MNRFFLGLLSLGTSTTITLIAGNSMGFDWPPKSSNASINVATQAHAKPQTNDTIKRGDSSTVKTSADAGYLSQNEDITPAETPEETSPTTNPVTQDTDQADSQGGTTTNEQETPGTSPSPTSTPGNDDVTPTSEQTASQSTDTTNTTDNQAVSPDNNAQKQARADTNAGVTVNAGGVSISLGL